MKDHPIIFSGPMIRALLAGRKTMTRRLAERDSKNYEGPSSWTRVKQGDRLWVRESIKKYDDRAWFYQADQTPIELGADNPKVAAMVAWSHHQERDYAPSIHMPRIFSRLTLTVGAVKIEHLQDISERDAVREGIYTKQIEIDGKPATGYFGANEEAGSFSAKREFECLWVGLHGTESWSADPEVVALTFTVHQSNIDALQVAA